METVENALQMASIRYESEVELEAAEMVKRGEAAPWEAVFLAGVRVQKRRRREQYEQ